MDVRQKQIQVEIDPIQKIKTAGILQLRILEDRLFEYAVIHVNFLDEIGNSIHDLQVLIEGDDFNLRWNTDQDLIEMVLEKCNVYPKGTYEKLRQQAILEEQERQQAILEEQERQQAILEEQERQRLEEEKNNEMVDQEE
jgi:hypothetical protein